MVRNQKNIALFAIFALLFSTMVQIQSAPAQASGTGLNMAIRADSRSLVWVKSQGFDSWVGGECYSTSAAVLTQNWGQAAPAANCDVDNFQVLTTGFIKAPVAGQYHFRVIANDAFDLRLNGKEVLKYWADSTGAGKTFTTTTAQSQTLGLNMVYPIALWYRDFTKEAHFKVQWKYPGSGDFADIPTQYLSPTAAGLLGSSGQVFDCETGIGLSPDCPAYSPQEIFDIHGTEANGEYWLMVAGQPTKVEILMDPAFTEGRGRGYVQLMWIGSSNGGGYTGLSGAGSRFQYDSPLWTDQYLTLNAGSGAQSTAKRNTYNFTPVNKVMARFENAANHYLNGTSVNPYVGRVYVNGDVTTPPVGMEASHFWIEQVPDYATGDPAYYTFNSDQTRTEAVIEPTTDRNLSSAVATTNRTVKRYKVALTTDRKNKLLGVIENPTYSFTIPPENTQLRLERATGKYGAFAADQNPYNEWYGFNYQSQEWNGKPSHIKMRWGFFSMARQKPDTRLYPWEPYLNPYAGEAEFGTYYLAPFCDVQGDGTFQINYAACFGVMDRFLAFGGVGLATSNAGAYQPVEAELTPSALKYVPSGEVKLTGGTSTNGQCARPGGMKATSRDDSWGQQTTAQYMCAYTTGLYGQMPDPTFSPVATMSATAVDGGFQVTWSAVAGATEYVFAHRKLGEPWKATRIQNPLNASDRERFVAERGPGTYQFKVTARKYDSAMSFSSSIPMSTSREVGVGLGGGDELLIAGNQSDVLLSAELGSKKLALSGLPDNSVVGLTVRVNSASATIASVSGLSTYSNRSIALSSQVTLNSSSPSITMYGSSTSVQAAMDSIRYQHLNPNDPVGSIQIEAFDAGTSTVIFNPTNQHYYKAVTFSSDVSFRNAYCQVKVGTNHATNGGGYDNCASGGTGRANYNGVQGYLATITSLQELNWISSSGLLHHLVPASNITDNHNNPSSAPDYDDMWIGASDLQPTSSAADGNFFWTDQAPTLERVQVAHDFLGNNGLTNSAVAGIKTHQRNSSKLSLTLLKTTQFSNYPSLIFANADSGDWDDVRSYLIEYSDDNGKNPLYKSRTIRFALAPEIDSHTPGNITAKGASISIAVDPGNSSTTIEVSYSATTETGTNTGFAVVSPAVTDSAGTVAASLTGLLPFTTYSYTVTVTNQGGQSTQQGEFRTGAGAPSPLALAAKDVTANSALLGVSVRPNASALTSITLQYSTTQNFASATSSAIPTAGIGGTAAQPAEIRVNDLLPDTTYYFKTTVQNSAGSSTSEILTFKTGPDLSAITSKLDSSSAVATLSGGLEVKANHPGIFPTNFNLSPAQDSTYISYTVKNTSGVAKENLWVSIDDFTGGSVGPVNPGETLRYVGDLAAGQSKTVYFYLKATAETETDQQHKVSVTTGQPGTDALTASAELLFSFDAVRGVSDGSGTVRDLRFNTSAPPLGGEFKLSVLGNVGSGSQPYFFTPAVLSNWPVDALRLEQIRIVFPDITSTPSCPSVVIDVQLITNSCYQGQNFDASYTFRVTDFPSGQLGFSPAVLSGAGSSPLSSNPGENPALLTTLKPQQNLSVTTTISANATPNQTQINGTTYSQVSVVIDVDNTSLRSSSLDQVLVDLDPTSVFDPDASYLSINGVRYSVSASIIDTESNLVAINGPIDAKAGDDVKLVLEVLVPQGTSDNISVSGKIGDVVVGPTPGTEQSFNVSIDNSGGITSTATTTSTPPRTEAASATEVFATTATLKGSSIDAPIGVTFSFLIGQTPDIGFNTKVVSASPYLSQGVTQQSFDAALTGLTPGSTYYYQTLYNGVPTGEILSFTTLRVDQPFVGLSSQPLPTATICNEGELECEPTVINPPVVSCTNCSISYTISSGVLPPGLSLDPTTGVISGTPTGSGGVYPFSLTATATSNDPNNPAPMVATQTYNLVSQPATAEPQILGSGASLVSNDSATITITGAYIPFGDLIKLTVTYTSSGTTQTIVNEIIAEGNGSSNQLISYPLVGLSPATTYSYQISYAGQQSTVFEFATTATATVPATPTVSGTAVVVEDNTAALSATISNPLPGDALGFVVGTTEALTDGRTYIAASSDASTQQVVTTQLTNLQPGAYFYRILLGDGLSQLTYPFRIGPAPTNNQISSSSPTQGSGGSGVGTTGSGSGTGSSSTSPVIPDNSSSSSAAIKYKTITKKYSYLLQGAATKLTKTQEQHLLKAIKLIPAKRDNTRVTAIAWVSKPATVINRAIALTRAKSVTNFLKGKLTANLKPVGDRVAVNDSKSSRRIDIWISYRVVVK